MNVGAFDSARQHVALAKQPLAEKPVRFGCHHTGSGCGATLIRTSKKRKGCGNYEPEQSLPQ